MRRTWTLAWTLTVVVGGACGGDAPNAIGPATTALFAPPAPGAKGDLASLPWPTDLLRDGSGGIQLDSFAPRIDSEPIDAVMLADLATKNGFGVTSGAFFPLSGAIDPATLDGHVRLVDLDGGADVPLTTFWRGDDNVIHARPQNGHVLLEKHGYAYLLTDDIHDAHGAPLAGSADWLALRDATAAPSDARLAAAWITSAKLLARLKMSDIDAKHVVCAAAFTTEEVTRDVRAMRGIVHGGSAPALGVGWVWASSPITGDDGSLDELLGVPTANHPGWDNPGGVVHDAIDFVVSGTFPAPDFLAPSTTVADPRRATETQPGRVSYDSVGAPMPQGTASVPFLLVVPKSAAASGYANLPVVIFQHGLGANRAAILAVANSVAAKGFAVVGIDIPFHGMRRGHAVDEIHNFTMATGPDGFADGGDLELTAFFDLNGAPMRNIPALDPTVMRASFQQSVSDMMAEVRLATEGDLSAVGQRDARLAQLSLRSDTVVYSGESFGSILGGITVAMEPKIGAAVLSVGGGGFVEPLVTWSPEYSPFSSLFGASLGVYTSPDPLESEFAYHLVQFLIEPGDPLAYAPYVLQSPEDGAAPRHVLLLEARHDESVPNIAGEHLAGAMGLEPAAVTAGGTPSYDWTVPTPTPHHAPFSGNVTARGKQVTAAIVQMTEATHGMFTTQRGAHTVDTTMRPFKKLASPVPVDNPIDALQAIYAAFADDYFAGRVPTLIDPQ